MSFRQNTPKHPSRLTILRSYAKLCNASEGLVSIQRLINQTYNTQSLNILLFAWLMVVYDTGRETNFLPDIDAIAANKRLGRGVFFV